MTIGMHRAVFELDDPVAADTPAVIGWWAARRPADPGHAAFGDLTSWRANVSANLAVAADQFAVAQSRLLASQRALGQVEERLRNLIAARSSSARGLLASPEQAILQLIDELAVDHLDRADQITEGWERATAQFRAFVERIDWQITHYAWVETRIAGQLVGRTVVDWSSVMRTVWIAGVGLAQIALHQQSLALALSSRALLLRSLTLAVRGAAILSGTMPKGRMLTLPAALRFINDVAAKFNPSNEPEAGR
jgi:hypothetical protein